MILPNKQFTEREIAVYVMTHGPICTWIDDYCIPMEIGAACREKHTGYLQDNTGDNISKKDNLYCEITGLYWMWKNDTHKYVGLYHYRRVFNLSGEKIHKILSRYDWIIPKQNWDQTPSMEVCYYCDHSKDDWEIMKTVLKEMYPKYYESSKEIFNNNIIFGLNMFVTSRENLDKYCSWLFPLISEIERQINLNDGRLKYNQKAIGIMCERLLTLYILHNKFSIKEVNACHVPPYFALPKIMPKYIAKWVEESIWLYNIVSRIQHKREQRKMKCIHTRYYSEIYKHKD